MTVEISDSVGERLSDVRHAFGGVQHDLTLGFRRLDDRRQVASRGSARAARARARRPPRRMSGAAADRATRGERRSADDRQSTERDSRRRTHRDFLESRLEQPPRQLASLCASTADSFTTFAFRRACTTSVHVAACPCRNDTRLRQKPAWRGKRRRGARRGSDRPAAQARSATRARCPAYGSSSSSIRRSSA